MEDFSTREQLLWAENVKRPFGDHPKVARSVISAGTAELAQETPVSWFREFAAWFPEREETGKQLKAKLRGFALRAHKTVGKDEKGKMKVEPSLVGNNLCDWTADVLDEAIAKGEELSAIALRREVASELQREADAAGEWNLWLTHLHWVLLRRAALERGEAPATWETFIASPESGQAWREGSKEFIDWLQSIQPVEKKGEEEFPDDEDDDSDSPLEEDGEQPTTEIPTGAV